MTNEEKQELAGLCKIEIKRWKAASEANPNMRYMVDLMELALAGLTQKPVKLAKDLKLSDKAHQSHCDYAEGYNDRAVTDRAAIREAGYEVQE